MAKHYFIPDLHGDADNFRTTLAKTRQANVGDDGKLTMTSDSDSRLILLGDYIDRGDQNLKTLEIVLSLIETFRERLVTLVGNHELAALQFLTHPRDARWTYEWLPHGGMGVLLEVASRKNLILREAVGASELSEEFLDRDTDGPLATRFRTFLDQAVAKDASVLKIDFPEAIDATRKMFFEGKFRPLFERLLVAYQIAEVYAIHAGTNVKGLRIGTKGLNGLYQLAFTRRNFDFLYDYYNTTRSTPFPLPPLFCMTKPLPPRTGNLLDDDTVRALKERGIKALVHGHAALKNGTPECNKCGCIVDVNLDITISRGHHLHREGADWGFGVFDDETGRLTAENAIAGSMDFGNVRNGEIHFT